MIHDRLTNWSLYFISDPWRCAFNFLAGLTSENQDARIFLQGEDMYAIIMTYETCSPKGSVLETHDEYIDIQMSLVNSEAIDWFYRPSLEVKVPYDGEKDRTLYLHPEVAPVRVNNVPGFFTVLFPSDAHMPKLITCGKTEIVKKVVVKVHRKLVLKKNELVI